MLSDCICSVRSTLGRRSNKTLAQFMSSSSCCDRFVIVDAFHCPLGNVILSILELLRFILHTGIKFRHCKCGRAPLCNQTGMYWHTHTKLFLTYLRCRFAALARSVGCAENAIEPPDLTKSNNSNWILIWLWIFNLELAKPLLVMATLALRCAKSAPYFWERSESMGSFFRPNVK